MKSVSRVVQMARSAVSAAERLLALASQGEKEAQLAAAPEGCIPAAVVLMVTAGLHNALPARVRDLAIRKAAPGFPEVHSPWCSAEWYMVTFVVAG